MSNANKEEIKVYDPLNEGDYAMSIKSVERRKSKKGDAMTTVVYEVTEGDMSGRLIFDNFLEECAANEEVPGYAIQRVTRLLQSLGVEEGFDGLGNDYGGLEGFVGKPFIGEIAYGKPYQGKNGLTIGNQVKKFKKA
mgnify:CR=1 FL=1